MVVLYVTYGTHLGLHMTVNRQAVTEGGTFFEDKTTTTKNVIICLGWIKDNVT